MNNRCLSFKDNLFSFVYNIFSIFFIQITYYIIFTLVYALKLSYFHYCSSISLWELFSYFNLMPNTCTCFLNMSSALQIVVTSAVATAYDMNKQHVQKYTQTTPPPNFRRPRLCAFNNPSRTCGCNLRPLETFDVRASAVSISQTERDREDGFSCNPLYISMVNVYCVALAACNVFCV